MRTLSIDVETANTEDLRKVGSSKYSKSGGLRVSVLAWAFDDEEVKSVVNVGRGQLPLEIKRHIQKGGPIHAWNASFEAAILRNYFGVNVRDRQLFCTMQRATYYGLPAALGSAGPALGLDIIKDKTAERLMKQMAKPRKRKGGLSWWHEDDQEKLAALRAYCEQDVRAERAISNVLGDLPHAERLVSLADREANEHGIRLDRKAIDAMIGLANDAVKQINAECATITNGAVSNIGSRSQALVDYLKDYCSDLKKATVVEALKRDDLPDDVRRILELRLLAAKASVKKLQAMLNLLEDGDVVRGVLQYYGASRTGRWSSKDIQVQNMARPTIKDPNAAIADMLAGNDTSKYGTPLDVISSCLRGVIVPREGKRFVTIDLAQIEARMLAWIAGQDDAVQVFSEGKDIYVHAAKKLGSDNRTLGKVLTLACGYGMGAVKFKDTALTYGLTLTDEEAQTSVSAWRKSNDKITKLWALCESRARAAIAKPGERQTVTKGVSMLATVEENEAMVLSMRLPSKRELFYRNIRIEDDDLVFDGVDQKTRKWGTTKTYSGKLAENLVQAASRDIIANAFVQIDKLKIGEVVMTIHDEIVVEVDAAHANDAYKRIHEILTTPPKWAEGLPLGADGYLQDRYGKDGDAPTLEDEAFDEFDDEEDLGGEGDDDQSSAPLPSTVVHSAQAGDQRREDHTAVSTDNKGPDAKSEEPQERRVLQVDFRPDWPATPKDFLKGVFGPDRWTSAWLANVMEKGGDWTGGPAPRMVGNLDLSGATYFSQSLMRPGAKTRDVENAIACCVVCIDDVGSKLKLKDAQTCGIEPSYIIETSPGNYQWGFILADPIEPGDGRLDAFYDGLKHGDFAKGRECCDRVHYIRMPFGVSWKEESRGFKTRLAGWNPELRYSIDELSVAFRATDGRQRATHSPKTQAERMSKPVLTLCVRAIPNTEKDFPNREDWIAMGHAIYGASGGEEWGRDLWVEWSDTYPEGQGEDPSDRWDTFSGASAGAETIRQHLERLGLDELRHDAWMDRGRMLFADDGDDEEAFTPRPKSDPASNPYLRAAIWGGDPDVKHTPSIVKGLITAHGFTFVSGQPNAGKSAIVSNLAVSLATGSPFANRKTKRTGVIYIASEAPGTIHSRINLAMKKMDPFGGDNGELLPIAIMPLVPNLLEAKERRRFVEAMQAIDAKMRQDFGVAVGAIIVDTYASAFLKDDEQAAAEGQKIMRVMDELAHKVNDAARILVHHLGKDKSKGMRGTSALWATEDDELQLETDAANRNAGTMEHFKSRSFRSGEIFSYELVPERVGVDADGDEITTVFARFPADCEDEEGEDELSAEEMEIAVVRDIQQHPRSSIRERATRTRINKTSVHRTLKSATGKGLIRARGKAFDLLKAARDMLENEGEE